jgi:hypothetical protein
MKPIDSKNLGGPWRAEVWPLIYGRARLYLIDTSHDYVEVWDEW